MAPYLRHLRADFAGHPQFPHLAGRLEGVLAREASPVDAETVEADLARVRKARR